MDHARAGALARALRRGLEQAWSTEEARWISRIEQTRGRMERSGEPLRTSATAWSGDLADERFLDETLGPLTRSASKPAASAGLLFALVREWKPETALELGTCVGLSAAYQAAGLELNERGHLWTGDASPTRSAIAERVLRELELSDGVTFVVGRFQETLAPILEALPSAVDYAFIDGHHDETATWEYFEQISASAADTAVLVLDDIHWSDGMERVWVRVAGDPRVAVSVDVGDMGICLLGRSTHDQVVLPPGR